MSIRRESSGGLPTLEQALAEQGIACRVEARAGLVVLIVDAESARAMGDAELRRTALAAAKAHGFTHVAIELRADAGR